MPRDTLGLRPDEASFALLALFEATPDAVLIIDDATSLVLRANLAAEQMFECDAAAFVGRTGRSFSAPEDEAFVDNFNAKIRKDGQAWHPRYPLRTENGRRFYADVRVVTTLTNSRRILLVVMRDVSVQVDQAQRLAQANRHATVGRIATGIAHDLNDPATIIATAVDSLRRRIDGPSDPATTDAMLHLTDNIRGGVDQIGEIAGILMSLAGPRDDVSMVSIDEIVKAAVTITGPELSTRALVELQLAAPTLVAARKTPLVQVVINLITNAAHAIEEGSPSTNLVRIETTQRSDGVVLAISDTGSGIPGDLAGRVFEAFVSTKPPGMGTGLGLTIASDIVAQHSGELLLDATGPQGSRFVLRLPTRTGLESEVPAEPTRPDVVGLRVLIVDDEPRVGRGLARMMMHRHDTSHVVGGRAALDLLERDRTFDVILCDLVMPDVDGPTIYRTVRARWPRVAERFVWMTAGTTTSRIELFAEQYRDRVVFKPFTLAELEAIFARVRR